MNFSASTVRRPLGVTSKYGSSESTRSAFVCEMSKKYQLFKKRYMLPSGGFIESFVMGIAEFSCLGEQHFDISGYPHESEFDGFAEDWGKLAQDAATAYKKLKDKTDI